LEKFWKRQALWSPQMATCFFPIVAIWLKGSICGEAFLGTCPETWISQKLMKIQSHELGMLWDWVKLCDRFIVIVYLDCSFW
jgi:hypothetical protein